MNKKLLLLLFVIFCIYQIPSIASNTSFVSFPIELVTFSATNQGDNVKLSWSTASEKSISYFTIEKTKDFLTYETVIVMNGSGSTNSFVEYETLDNSPFIGKSYYRLKLTDFSGDFIYSGFVAVEISNALAFSMDVYPNPSSGDNINLLLNAEANQEVLVVVYDITGKENYSKVLITSTNGENVYAVDPTSKLIPGVYLITATSQQNIYSKRLIVK